MCLLRYSPAGWGAVTTGQQDRSIRVSNSPWCAWTAAAGDDQSDQCEEDAEDGPQQGMPALAPGQVVDPDQDHEPENETNQAANDTACRSDHCREPPRCVDKGILLLAAVPRASLHDSGLTCPDIGMATDKTRLILRRPMTPWGCCSAGRSADGDLSTLAPRESRRQSFRASPLHPWRQLFESRPLGGRNRWRHHPRPEAPKWAT